MTVLPVAGSKRWFSAATSVVHVEPFVLPGTPWAPWARLRSV
ncbi:hypothetical protein ACWDZ4_32160 [Streptomyces sp. NPDC003016]